MTVNERTHSYQQTSPTSTIFPTSSQDGDVRSQVAEKRSMIPNDGRRSSDVEREGEALGQPVEAAVAEKKDSERFTVRWSGPDDPGCPLNTPVWKKW